MYLPKHFEVTDLKEITQFVARVGAVDLVTTDQSGQPISTLMPCIWDVSPTTDGNYGMLIMHMAKSNDQWKSIGDGKPGLAIVSGTQGYISPSNYGNKVTDHKVVPTWNYQRVHLSGIVEVSEDTERLREIVSTLTGFHESKRHEPWTVEDAEPRYLEGQLKAIVAVTMQVERVEAKYKLSQNRPEDDQVRIIDDLLRSEDTQAHEVARAMEENL